jgi:hypothetical protein
MRKKPSGNLCSMADIGNAVQYPKDQMNEEGSLSESDKMHAGNYKGNVIQIDLPMNAFKRGMEVMILPIQYIGR